MNLDPVFELIRAERHEQTKKWGYQANNKEKWACLVIEEALEYVRAVNDGEPTERIREELVQLAALCCQILEQ